MTETGIRWLKPSLQEWLETDGLGGFASSTTSGIHTRRYHGWLFVAGDDPGERWLCLSKVEDTCMGPEGKWELSSNFYPGTTYPNGTRHIWAFSKDPFPTFTFKIHKYFLERELFMVKGIPGVFCIYRIRDAAGMLFREGFTLRLRPLCNSRFYHYTAKEGSWNPSIHCLENAVLLKGHSRGNLALVCTGGLFRQDARWYKNMVYPVERDRGLDYTEDHLSPGYFTTHIKAGEEIVFWAGPVSESSMVTCSLSKQGLRLSEFALMLRGLALQYRDNELRRRRQIAKEVIGNSSLGGLYLAADQFVISTRVGTSIIAGYHWFGEWGRDTFIAMPGLLLHTKRFTEAREVFLRFGREILRGLVPNRFAEGKGAAYNSADASLWFIDALGKYERASGDWEFVKILVPAVGEIIRSYIQGTDYGIKVHCSGMLAAGTHNTQLTWMDACVNGIPVTPRGGFPVEINALWIRALTLYGNWLKRLAAGSGSSTEIYRHLDAPRARNVKAGRDNPETFLRLAVQARREFRRLFAWPGVGLYDRIDNTGPVPEIRPNQIIAGSIKEVGLPRHILVEIWNTCFQRLLSPHGVRTLAPFSKHYRGRYAGGPDERDSAYHQGTAWPWLLGPFFDLYMRLFEDRAGAKPTGDVWPFGGWEGHLGFGLVSRLTRLDSNPCIGSIFEVASGDPPFEAGGTIAQAWSVAELIRILSFLDDTPCLAYSPASQKPF